MVLSLGWARVEVWLKLSIVGIRVRKVTDELGLVLGQVVVGFRVRLGFGFAYDPSFDSVEVIVLVRIRMKVVLSIWVRFEVKV